MWDDPYILSYIDQFVLNLAEDITVKSSLVT